MKAPTVITEATLPIWLARFKMKEACHFIIADAGLLPLVLVYISYYL
jgi:hypothetical protein